MDKKVKIKWPKLSGEMSFKAKKGKCLPIFIASGKIQRIDDKKAVKIDCSKVPYDSGNILKRAIVQGDIEIYSAKGGK